MEEGDPTCRRISQSVKTVLSFRHPKDAPGRPMFTGCFTALITPLRDGKVDEDAFQALVDRQIKEGISGLVPCGTTGESPTLTPKEHTTLIELCVEAAAERVPVIAGTGSNSTLETIGLSSGEVRLPLCLINRVTRTKVRNAMAHAGLISAEHEAGAMVN